MRRNLTEEEHKLVKFLMAYITEHHEKLSAWELSFVISVEEWYGKDGMLSDSQVSKLNEIFSRCD